MCNVSFVTTVICCNKYPLWWDERGQFSLIIAQLQRTWKKTTKGAKRVHGEARREKPRQE